MVNKLKRVEVWIRAVNCVQLSARVHLTVQKTRNTGQRKTSNRADPPEGGSFEVETQCPCVRTTKKSCLQILAER